MALWQQYLWTRERGECTDLSLYCIIILFLQKKSTNEKKDNQGKGILMALHCSGSDQVRDGPLGIWGGGGRKHQKSIMHRFHIGKKKILQMNSGEKKSYRASLYFMLYCKTGQKDHKVRITCSICLFKMLGNPTFQPISTLQFWEKSIQYSLKVGATLE